MQSRRRFHCSFYFFADNFFTPPLPLYFFLLSDIEWFFGERCNFYKLNTHSKKTFFGTIILQYVCVVFWAKLEPMHTLASTLSTTAEHYL